MNIPKEVIEKILDAANLKDVIEQYVSLARSGSNYTGTCPMCGKSGKGAGLSINPAKNIYKCFSCDWGGKSPANFLMETQKMSFPEAIRHLANMYSIDIPEEKRPEPTKKSGNHKTSFRDLQLKLSGLTDKDQKTTIPDPTDPTKQKIIDVYQAGSLDEYGRITTGDDMVIWYYDLDRNPVTFIPPNRKKPVQLFRIRWQVPELHPDKEGRPVKYKSPYGSGTHLYIPDAVSRAYREGRQIRRLFIQEGEKKADKCCKHGLFSVGIMGIQNIGSHNRLPYEFQLIVKQCDVKEIVFVLDADWDHLSNNLDPNRPADQRPRSFYYAVKNFKDYFKSLANSNIYIDTYFAHIKGELKGIDDLLAANKDKEQEIVNDFQFALNEKSGEGKYVHAYKTTAINDIQLMEIWQIHNLKAFVEKYAETLKSLPEFTFSRHRYKFDENGQVVLAQPLTNDEMFWEEVHNKNGTIGYQFDYENCYNFLQNRGFGRIMMKSGKWVFARIQNQVVDIIEAWQIRDYVMELARDICGTKGIRNMLYRGGKMYFGPDSLGNLSFMEPTFQLTGKSYQRFFFNDLAVEVTADNIKPVKIADMTGMVWKDKIKHHAFTPMKPLFEAEKITPEMAATMVEDNGEKLNGAIGMWNLTLSDEAKECHFLRFLLNTGNFYWSKYMEDIQNEQDGTWHRRVLPVDTRTLVERLEINDHFMSKVTAIGYLLHKFRDKSIEKAIIAMDGKLSEVGESNGRSGKSLLGKAIEYIVSMVYIGGKDKGLTEDRFIFEEVTENSDVIFIDDVRPNLDFEFFFTVITGTIAINAKGIGKFTLRDEDVPKLYITTNHAIGGDSSSFRKRQAMIAFSDYYNEVHEPINDFGQNFFQDWDYTQWNLFYNFMLQCLQSYLKYGIITPPTDRLERRRMRQFLGESFLTWADAYFGLSDDMEPEDSESDKINQTIPREELYTSFCDGNPKEKTFTPPHKFKKKILTYCKYRGVSFNPQRHDKFGKPGADHKTGGVEYFTIANARFGEENIL